LLGRELELGGSQVVEQLLARLCAENDARDEGAGQLPGERNARHRDAMLPGHLVQRAQHLLEPVRIDRRKVEGCAAGPCRTGFFRIELAGQQASSERAPGQDRQALALRHRHELALDVTACDRVINLGALEAREAVRLGKANRLHCEPGGQIAETHVPRFAAASDVIQSAHGFLDRRRGIETMDLVQVHVVEAEP
jgi:hypothetical protein